VVKKFDHGIALLLAGLTACSWTQFDDLRDEAWVAATERPDNGSSNWGLAIQRGRLTSSSGGTLTVLGTAEAVYNEVSYSATGDDSIAPTQVDLGDLGVGALDAQSVLLADPTSDKVALVTKTGPQQVVVFEGSAGALTPHQVFGADSTDAAAFMVAPGIDNGPTPQPAQPIIGAADTLWGTFFNPPNQPFIQVRCQLLDGGDPVQIRALSAVRLDPAATTDDIAVWTASGKLYIVDGNAFNGERGACAASQLDITAAPQLDVGFAPGSGSQIIVFDGSFALLQGHGDAGGFLQVVDLMNLAAVGNPITEGGVVTAALFDDAGTLAVAAGYPQATIDGVACGKVMVYPLDSATGIAGPSPIETLHDAQAEDGQTFGRSIAVVPFNGRSTLAVGADNEVFLYFRTANLYSADTRQGR
jgi:hypothetical protein